MTLAPPRVTAPSPARTREAWVDVGKGVAILLVVLFHAGGYASTDTAGGSAWNQVNAVLVSARMPLFFLVSGLFVGSALRTLSARRFLRRKVWPPAYLFVLWALIYGALDLASRGTFGGALLDSMSMQTTLWYVAGLAIHMAVAWWLRRIRPAVQISGAALLSVPFAVWLPFELGGLAHIPQYLVFFLVGCHYREAVTGLVRGARILRTGGFVLAGVGLLAVAVLLRRYLPQVQELQAAVLFGVLPLVAVPTVLIGCRAVEQRAVGGVLAWLGRHTLPVFLLHPLALQVLDVLGSSAAGEIGPLAWFLPPVLAGIALVMSLMAWHVLEMYAPWLFAPAVQVGRHGTVGFRVRGRGARNPTDAVTERFARVGRRAVRAGVDDADTTVIDIGAELPTPAFGWPGPQPTTGHTSGQHVVVPRPRWPMSPRPVVQPPSVQQPVVRPPVDQPVVTPRHGVRSAVTPPVRPEQVTGEAVVRSAGLMPVRW